MTLFKKLLAESEFDQLVARCPLRESSVLSTASRALEVNHLYEQTLIARVQADTTLGHRLTRTNQATDHSIQRSIPSIGCTEVDVVWLGSRSLSHC